MITRQFQNLHQALRNLVKDDAISWEIGDGIFLFNGEPQGEAITKTSPVRWIIKQCYERHVNTVRIQSNCTQSELENFGKVMNRLPGDFPGNQSAGQFLDQLGVKHIQVNLVADRPSSSASISPSGKQAAATTPAPSNAPTLSLIDIPQEDLLELKKTISSLVQNNRMDKVSEILKHIHQDLFGPDRRNRELAVYSFQVVILVLIEFDQEQPLLQIYKNMPKDLARFQELDLFQIDLQTFTHTLTYFIKKLRFSPFLAGLEYLAEGPNLPSPHRIPALTTLNSFLDGNQIERLVRATSQNPEWKQSFFAFCRKHGVHLLKPLLGALFQSGERNVRHVLMTLLTELGPVIHPEVMEAMQQNAASAWYIRRNILQLLGSRPPAELFPYLMDMLAEDEHPKVRDLALRALYAIPGKDPYFTGLTLMKKANKDFLLKILAYIAQGGVKTYATDLVELCQSDVGDDVRRAAMLALAHLDVHDGNQFLIQTLSADSLFGGKSKQTMRFYAAEAIAVSENANVRRELAKFVNDRNRDVRDLVTRTFA
ncbi:MAG: HEAT repeat domain-containing protein [Acidobacteria bacterium]|nr:HEAT repeat domain-containing protein [Acidobacteriota bacterium]